jgi:imidazole glycerol-phosphate synthase subunit HisH
MIGIVEYGSGNIKAIANIYHRRGIPFFIASQPADLSKADKIILPGVGAFDHCMGELERSGMKEPLNEIVLGEKKPVLGICVGMQLMAASSEEGRMKGLNWIDAEVKKFDESLFSDATHLPHMGWNEVKPMKDDPIFKEVDLQSGYYFLHSYYFSCNRQEDILAKADYGNSFTCAVKHENIYGVQFHPEKSHHAGISLLENFARLD